MYVKQKKTGQMGYLPDDQFDSAQYEQITDPNVAGQLDSAYKQTQAQNIVQPQDTTQTQGGGDYITGRSLQEHQQALQAARQAGDKTSEADILSNYNAEYQYQKDSGKIKSALTPTEQSTLDEDKQKKEAAARSKNEALSLVDDLLTRDTGAITGAKNPLKYLMGDAQYTKALTDQLKSKLSLEARSLLKGSGQISDIEVKMLTDSVAALATNKKGAYTLKNEDFKKELLRIKKALGGEVTPPDITSNKESGISTGGVLGGILGGAGGAIAGGPIGAGVGGAAGAMAGGATENLILNLLGKQTKAPMEQLSQVGGQAAITGVTAPIAAGVLPGLLRFGGKAIGLNTAKNIATNPSIQEKVVNVGKKIESLNPAKFMRGKQIEAADKLSNIKIDTKSIEDSVKPLIKKIPSLQATYDEYSGVIKSIKTPKDALEALDIFKDAFSQAGRVKAGLEPKLLRTLYDATLKALPKDVATYRTLTKYAIDLPKTAGKALWRGTLGKILLGP